MTIELRLFGSLQLSASDGRALESLIRQPKRMALLAYLAAATPRGFHRRDTLLALFWPELNDGRSRAALNQALYVVRNALGDQGILTRGDGEIALNGDVVRCDAVAFEAALDAGRPGDALVLYRGDLLAGFFVPGAAEFDRWVETQRVRLRQRAAEGAWAAAETKAAEGDAVEGARWARRAADLAPADESVARRLMTFLDRVGDRAAALRFYEAFAWRLKTEYELEPSAETDALAVALRERGGKAADVRFVNAPSSPGTILVAIKRNVSPGWLAASVLLIAALATGASAVLREPAPPPDPTARFVAQFPGARVMTGGVTGSTIALAPDGRWLAAVVGIPSSHQIVARPLGDLAFVPVRHTSGGQLPFFSHDGAWLGFVAEGRMRKVRLDGGPAFTLCAPDTTVFGATWSRSGEIIFATPAALWAVSEQAGEPRILAATDTATGTHYRWPAALPGGKAVVVTVIDASGFQLATVSLRTGEVRRLGVAGTSPYFVAPGTLVFARPDGVLLAAPFDEQSLTVTGPAIAVTDGVSVGTHGAAKVGVSRSGHFAYVPERFADRRLVLVDRRGKADTVPAPPQGYHHVRLAPDGRRLATSILISGQQDVWSVDIDRGTFRRLTFDSTSTAPEWTPDGRRVVFATSLGGREPGFVIRSVAVDGGDSIRTILSAEHARLPLSVAGDGGERVIQRMHPVTRRDLWILSLDSTGSMRPLVEDPYDQFAAAMSPDGKRVAYVSNESGRDEIYVRAYPPAGPAIPVSVAGGREPRWASETHELFYRTDSGLVAARLDPAPAIAVRRRERLFDDRPYLAIEGGAGYDVDADGQRFVMIRRGPDAPEIVVVLNWFDHLRPRRR